MAYMPPRLPVPHKATYKQKENTANETCRVCGKEALRYSHTVEMDVTGRAISKWENAKTPGYVDVEGSLGMYPIGPKCSSWLRKEHPEFYQKYVYA